METMRSNAVLNSEGIKCASPDILRISMYLELSRPDGNIERWNKVFERLSLLNINVQVLSVENYKLKIFWSRNWRNYTRTLYSKCK